jgi:hypothetical protein
MADCTSPRCPVATKARRLDDHPLAARGQIFPPTDGRRLVRVVSQVVGSGGHGKEHGFVRRAEARQRRQVPPVVLVDVDRTLARQEVERRELEIRHPLNRPAVAAVGDDHDLIAAPLFVITTPPRARM